MSLPDSYCSRCGDVIKNPDDSSSWFQWTLCKPCQDELYRNEKRAREEMEAIVKRTFENPRGKRQTRLFDGTLFSIIAIAIVASAFVNELAPVFAFLSVIYALFWAWFRVGAKENFQLKVECDMWKTLYNDEANRRRIRHLPEGENP